MNKLFINFLFFVNQNMIKKIKFFEINFVLLLLLLFFKIFILLLQNFHNIYSSKKNTLIFLF